MSTRLPMFPLGTVLTPTAVLPLHVFEPRYRVLMFDCLRGDRQFGVVLIERGSEVGGDDQRFSLATVAQVAEAAELPDGRWFVLAVGTRRVDVVQWLSDDPYPVALVEERAELPWPGGPGGAGAGGKTVAALAAAEAAVRRALELAQKLGEELGEEVVPSYLDLSPDPSVRAWELLAAAPIASLDKQRLLAVDDPVERLKMLAVVAKDQAFLLAYRLNRE